MSIDLGQRAANYALYTPSAQVAATESVTMPDHKLREGPMPAGLTARSLDYFWSKNPIWHYPYVLATAGHFKDAKTANAITSRTSGTVLVGDSSGFNLGQGSMPETKAWMKYVGKPTEVMRLFRESSIKVDVLHWLETNADLAMTLDVPLWAAGIKGSPFCNFTDEQLLTLSVENLEYFQQEAGKFRQVKYLNVLQGTTIEVEEQWFQTVKGFQFHGYAFAGHVGQMGGIYRVLRRVLLLRDLGLLEPPNNNLHILRLSRPRWAPILTAIQRTVRETINPEFTITFDSSSPYKIGGMTSQYASLTDYGTNLDKGWSIKNDKAPLGYGFANMADPLPLNVPHPQYMPVAMDSPVASLLTVKDINFNSGKRAVRTVDRFGDAVLVNHNCYVYIMAMILANEAVFADKPTAPEAMMEAVKVIADLFRAKNWQAMLDDKRGLLASVVGDKR